MLLREYTAEHGTAGLAAALQTSPAYIWQLANGVRRVTAEKAVKIEAATHGKVSRQELRPDVFGEPPRATKRQRERPAA